MNNLFAAILMTTIFLSISCGNTNMNSTESDTTWVEEETTDGVYRYSDSSVEAEVTVSGDTWYAVAIPISGFGEDYDQQNAMIESGLVDGNDLYESSGMIKIGRISGTSLRLPLNGVEIRLEK